MKQYCVEVSVTNTVFITAASAEEAESRAATELSESDLLDYAEWNFSAEEWDDEEDGDE